MSKNMKNYTQLTFFISLISLIGFKHIPFIGRIPNKFIRVFSMLGILTIPTYFILYNQIELIKKEKNMIYE